MIDYSLIEIRGASIEYINKHSRMRLKPLENLKIGSIHINKIHN